MDIPIYSGIETKSLIDKRLDDLEKLYHEQLTGKDEEIKRLHEILNHNQKLLDQSQQLQLIAEHKIKQLEEPKKTKTKEPVKKYNVDEVENKKMKNRRHNNPRVIYREKRSFWYRFK